MATIYSIDTNSLMDWQARYFPADVFPGLFANMDQLVASNRLVAPELVREEAAKVGTTGLQEWVEAHASMFVGTSTLLQRAIAIQGQFPGLRDPKAEFEEADAYVIALAQLRGGIVVSQETSASEKHRPRRTHYIPDVCRELGISCFNLLGLMRSERWKF